MATEAVTDRAAEAATVQPDVPPIASSTERGAQAIAPAIPSAQESASEQSFAREEEETNPSVPAGQFLAQAEVGEEEGDNASQTGDSAGAGDESPLENPSHYVDPEFFFTMLQDEGVEPPEKDRHDFLNNAKLSKSRHIRFGPRLYPNIWKVSSSIFKNVLLPNRESIVPKMSRNATHVVRDVGTEILSRRSCKGRGDLHSVVADNTQMELATMDANFCDNERLYFLSQRELLSWALDKWGQKASDEKIATPDDYLRAIGIIFIEEMREYIRYLVKDKDPDGWMEVDEWRGKRNTAHVLFHQKFIDLEVRVDLPPIWLTEESKARIDEHMGQGTYDALKFDPNNPSRIAIAWTKEESIALLGSGLAKYAAMMVKYTWGTGGGDGHPVVSAVWTERHELQSVTYLGKKARQSVFLSVVHIWDKSYNFPLTVVKGRVPEDSAIDDSPTNNQTGQQVTPSSSTGRRPTNGEQAVIDAIATSTASRAEVRSEISSATLALKSFIENAKGAEESETDQRIKLADAIDHTNGQIENFTSQKRALEEQRKAIAADDKRAAKKIKKQIKIKDRLIDEFTKTLESHLGSLSALNGGDDNDASDDNRSSDESESDGIDE